MPAWHIPGVDQLHARRPACGRSGPESRAPSIAVVFTYLTLGLRRLFASFPPRPGRSSAASGLALLAIWSPYALTFGEVQTGHVLGARVWV